MNDQDNGENESKSPNPQLQQPTMAYLPFEVITDILARLPVKALLRLRSVAKPWRSLIDSHRFIHLHIAKSSAERWNLGLVLRKKRRLFAADIGGEPETVDTVELPHPLMCYSNEINVLGVCNGLLCLSNVAEDIAIWNPATRTHRILPYLPTDRSRLEAAAAAEAFIRGPRVYGFGYDAAGDDYKLVRVSQFIGLDYTTYESEVRVFSVRSNEWKAVDDVPFALCYTSKMGVHLNGFMHWVVIRKIAVDAIGFLLSFDLVAESYKEVALPQDESGGVIEWEQLDLGVLNGCLSFVALFKDSGFDVWVMMEYGVTESWTKVVSLGEGFRTSPLLRPLTYSKSGGEILFEQDNKIFWYELKSQRVKTVPMNRGVPDTFDAFVCLSSLAPVNPRSREDERRDSGSIDDASRRRDNFLSEGFKLVL